MPANLLAPIVLLALFSAAVFADEHDATESRDEKAEEVDYTKLSLSKLRRASEEAAEDFYSAYSDANVNDEFDVHCDYKRPTGSRRKVHSCEPRYMLDIQMQHATRNWDNRMDAAGNAVETETKAKAAEFEENLSTVVSQSPELQQKLVHYNMLLTLLAERNKR